MSTQQSRVDLNALFIAGAEPTAANFADVFTSNLNLEDDSTVTGAVTFAASTAVSAGSFKARGYAATTPGFIQKFPAHTAETAGALTVTIAKITSGLVVMDPTADRAFTLTTAALAVAGVVGVAVGDCIDFTIINTGTASEDEIITLAAGTGGTLVGSGAILTANAVDDAFSSGSGLFRLRFDNVTGSSEAITVYRLA